jgi:SAM-dependent methyltransferase
MSAEPPSAVFDQVRRREPRIVDTDWLVLRGLSTEVASIAAETSGPGVVAVDFGCGDQPYRSLFEQCGAEYLGADLGQAAQIVIRPDGHVDAPNACADLVLSFQVLEHVRDLDTYLSEAKRLLRPGGQLILSTHGTWLYHPHPEDHRRWTRMGLVNELESRGWTVDCCTAVVGPLAWTTLIRLTGYCFALRKLPLVGNTAAAFLALVMNLRAAAEDKLTPSAIRDDNACVYVVRAHFARESS